MSEIIQNQVSSQDQSILERPSSSTQDITAAMERLVNVVQRLSLARSIQQIREIVKKEARAFARSDGATFVLKDGNCCYYVDEYAIAPLWKGKRFPLEHCVSGWVMKHKQSVAIQDIYADPRVPHEAYRPTFVKSLLMVPIRSQHDPVGAIGNYWAHHHQPTADEIRLLEALANSTSIAMENVQVYSELEQRVKDRTHELELVNKELESFSYTLSHDLRSHIQVIDGFNSILLGTLGNVVEDKELVYLNKIKEHTKSMLELIQDILNLSRLQHMEMKVQEVNLSQMVETFISDCAQQHPDRKIENKVQKAVIAKGDAGLLKVIMDNLLNNAWKYSSKKPSTYIEFGILPEKRNGLTVFYLRDRGAGFDAEHATNIFKEFQRFHTSEQFPGTGIGLSTVQRVITRHKGEIWVESAVDEGTTFYFTLGL